MNKKERLTKLLNEGYEFVDKNLTSEDNRFIAWYNSLIRFIELYYGKESILFKQFDSVKFSPTFYGVGTSKSVFQKYFNDGLDETLKDLERLVDEIEDLKGIERKSEKNKNPFMNIQIENSNKNVNSNSNSNSIIIKTYDEVKNEIENNTFLDEKTVKELLGKLEEIKEIEKSKDSKTKKWSAAKKIFSFILDKGADIAILYIPLILQAISK